MDIILGLKSNFQRGQNSSEWPHFNLYGRTYWSFVLFIAVTGIVGNVLQFLMMCDRKFCTLSYSVYLRLLSVSDSVVLIGQFCEETEKEYEEFSLAVNNSSSVLHLILRSSWFSTKILSPWLLVGLSLDRYVSLCFPLKRMMFCTKKKAIVVCSAILVFSVLVMFPVVVILQTADENSDISKSLDYYLILLRLVISSTLPCSCILVLNTLTIFSIQRSRRFRSAFVRSRSDSTNQKKDSSRRPLALISLLAFVTLMPVAVAECTDAILIVTGINSESQKLCEHLLPLFNLIYMINFGQDFYIMIVSAPGYRKTLFTMCRCLRTNGYARRQTIFSMPLSENMRRDTSLPVLSDSGSVNFISYSFADSVDG